jgi:hypothetical protein
MGLRVRWMLLSAILLFFLVLGVSRVADFGILPGHEFGAADVERNKVKLELSVETASGEVHPIGRELTAGDRLALEYGPTRYPYLWVVAIDPRGRAQPLVEGKLTESRGERLLIEPPQENFVLLCLFSAVPRTLEQIQSSLDREVQLPGLRYQWIIQRV